MIYKVTKNSICSSVPTNIDEEIAAVDGQFKKNVEGNVFLKTNLLRVYGVVHMHPSPLSMDIPP